jgi:DNA-binding NarL/FixJ family response regulator
MKKILLIDDHPIMRHGLSQLIRAETDFEVCAEAASAEEGMKAIAESKPDLAIVDLTLKDKHGLELIKDIKVMYPQVLVVVLSMHDESLYAERALRAGARGYVMKETASDTLVKAIRKVLAGSIYVSEAMAGKLLEQLSGPRKRSETDGLDRLTDRELEVLGLIGQGKATRHIAKQLHVSVRTVDAHRAHIKEKLQLTDGGALVRFAVRWAADA